MIISWTPASFAAAMMAWEPASGSKRQISDMAAEHVGRPLIERRAIEPYLSAHRLPYTDQHAHQRRLARCAWADDAQSVSGPKSERHILNDDLLISRRHDADTLDRQAARWVLQQRLRGLRGQGSEQPVKAVPALARSNETFPVRDGQIDRRQRPRAQDRARDDNTRGRLLMNHQIGADREHRRLQGHAHDLGNRAETAGDVAGTLIARKIILVSLAPAPGQ